MKRKVENVMARNVRIADANMTIGGAAKLRAESDAGTLPVSDQGRLVGMLTDRDSAVRAVAQGLNSDTPVRQVMTKEISCCRTNDDIEDVLEAMAELKVRRMPIQDDDDQLVGIVPLNIVEALAKGDMLALIFVAILVGVGTVLTGEAGKPFAGLLQSLSAVLLKIVGLVMEATPIDRKSTRLNSSH